MWLWCCGGCRVLWLWCMDVYGCCVLMVACGGMCADGCMCADGHMLHVACLCCMPCWVAHSHTRLFRCASHRLASASRLPCSFLADSRHHQAYTRHQASTRHLPGIYQASTRHHDDGSHRLSGQPVGCQRVVVLGVEVVEPDDRVAVGRACERVLTAPAHL
jgi:hypothetical protein